MLTVLIETRNSEESLALTLASLVGGAIEGVVRKVIVCDHGSTDGTRQIADHAGCDFSVTGGVAAGIGQARGDWLLLLEPGARLIEGWIDDVVAHSATFTTPARFSRARGSRAPFLSRVLSRPSALADGLLITRRQAIALSRDSAEAIARGLAAKRLKAEIWAASRERG